VDPFQQLALPPVVDVPLGPDVCPWLISVHAANPPPPRTSTTARTQATVTPVLLFFGGLALPDAVYDGTYDPAGP